VIHISKTHLVDCDLVEVINEVIKQGRTLKKKQGRTLRKKQGRTLYKNKEERYSPKQGRTL